MKCECGARIKKGVDFRISELASYDEPIHPSFRPKYIHLMPLAEIIAQVYDKGVTTKTVQNKWQKLIDSFGSEIDVLINVDLKDIEKVDINTAHAIELFRNAEIDVTPGGGGKYGQISFEKPEKEVKPNIVTLDNF